MTSASSALAAEPMYFFPHDVNANCDIKCQRLIHRLGWDGYGRWWRLCEHMAATKGHMVEFQTEEDALILAGVLGFTAGLAEGFADPVERVTGYIETLLDIGLLERDVSGALKNSRMLENALYFGKQRANGRKGGRPKKTSRTSKDAGQEV